MASSSGTLIPTDPASSLWRDAWLRLSRNRLAVAGAFVTALLFVLCFVGPLFCQPYYEQHLGIGATPPSAAHWLGTDTLGRDLLSRILYGGRISLMVGFAASFVALTIGVSYGAVSGYCGGKVDSVMMRIVDILYALPFTIFVILVMVFLKDPMRAFDAWLAKFSWFAGTQGMGKILALFASIGAVEWLTMARVVRAQVMAIRKMDYIDAARSLGYGRVRIIVRHLLPNTLGPIVVYATLTVPAVMLLEAFLSYLGLGVDAPMSSWGTLIKNGAEQMEVYPWLLIFPASIFSVSLLALNFLGDGLRDALDVKSSKD